MLNLFYPTLNKERIIENIYEVLSNKMIGDGEKVREFENKVSDFLANNYPGSTYNTVALNSATAAIHLALILAGVKRDDEVITPVLTCTATNHPILWLGAKPVFADIQEDTLNIDPEDVARKITPKTKAIIVMHNGGQPCDMDKIMSFGIKVIEDTAQGFGGEYKGQKLGTIGDYGCLSFQAIKTITCGDGGMLVCKNYEDYQRAKRLKWYAIDREQQKKRESLVPSKFSQFFKQRAMTFDIDETGYKYTMNNIMASIGLANLEKAYEYINHRRHLAEIYRKELNGLNGIRLLRDAREEHANWLFQILVDDREEFQKFMGKHGIETNMVQVRNDVYAVFGGERQELPNMNKLENNYVSLPMHCGLSDSDVYGICQRVKEFSILGQGKNKPQEQ